MNSIEQLEKELKHHLAVTSFGGFEFNVTEWLEKYKSSVKERILQELLLAKTAWEYLESLSFQEGDVQTLEVAKRAIENIDKIFKNEQTKVERFIKPTDDQIVKFAIVFNEGKIEEQKLADLVGFCSLVVNRLYDRGVINKKSDEEIEIEKEDNKGDVAL